VRRPSTVSRPQRGLSLNRNQVIVATISEAVASQTGRIKIIEIIRQPHHSGV
jgi:hypothetical protein